MNWKIMFPISYSGQPVSQNDLELLKLAEKAAGFEPMDYLYCLQSDDWSHAAQPNSKPPTWNPLIHDRDAWHLAVKLGLAITPYPIYTMPKHSVIVKLHQHRDTLRESGIGGAVPYGNDPMAATRRAIVIAAAEIGKAMS